MYIEQYRQARNLVVCFCRELTPDANRLLLELRKSATGIAAEEGVPVVVVAGDQKVAKNVRQELDLPFRSSPIRRRQ